MAKTILPEDPDRADHRMIRHLLSTFFKDKSPANIPKEFDRVAEVFVKSGGSWKDLFEGSAKDLSRLKKCLKVAIEKGVISKRKGSDERP